ncbi:ABC transporter permease [Haloarchaeobius sp. DFWS5]|uniref:ABC transporter permease n=1 Tax=Haloarchaeobius sp. DFWS5 TaxID=3446114 RepID=UPI003EC008E3
MSELGTRERVGAGLIGLFAVLLVLDVVVGDTISVVFAEAAIDALQRPTTYESALRLATPIALAAIGGIFAEKSGVINIGIEGLLIVSALFAVIVTHLLDTNGIVGGTGAMWLGAAGGVLASMLLALLFAAVCIEFKADQIIAGLAVWLIALGVAPFAMIVLYGQKTTPTTQSVGIWSIPLLSDIPGIGPILFEANPFVFFMIASVPTAWYVLNHTSFGAWVRASGENPKALDTVGVSVDRVRYSAVLLSGFFAGLGGTWIGLNIGRYTTGATGGRGFIAIAAFLFGNYNPIGAFGASFLFSGLTALQRQTQDAVPVPSDVFTMLPYLLVIVVLVFVGKTRIPEAAGDHYDSGEE